jgi:YebC/PmpR family DNA-binding regulatory protein
MAGHSKWKNIQYRKSGQDAKRGKMFTKFIREISTAARLGGEDLNSNPRLRTAVDKALTQNMTKDTITRAIKRGIGNDDGAQLEEIRYEGYGPNGVAVIVDCLSDNKNRTVADVRHAFNKCGGNLGTTGSVAYLFNQTGLINFEDSVNEEKIMEIAIEAGANDVMVNDDSSIDVLTEPDQLLSVKDALQAAKLNVKNAEVTWLPSMEVKLNLLQAEEMLRLIEMLEDLDDVQQVFSNADIPDEILNNL